MPLDDVLLVNGIREICSDVDSTHAERIRMVEMCLDKRNEERKG